MLRNTALLALWLIFSCTLQAAEPRFPKLTGNVVDNANLLSSAVQQRISSQLTAHENATGNQVVVVTPL